MGCPVPLSVGSPCPAPPLRLTNHYKRIYNASTTMNVCPDKTRELILRCLCEGMSVRATARTAAVGVHTVQRMLLRAGEVCSRWQHHTLRNLECDQIQVDELWGFIYVKDKALADAKSPPRAAGTVWLFTALIQFQDNAVVACWRPGRRYGHRVPLGLEKPSRESPNTTIQRRTQILPGSGTKGVWEQRRLRRTRKIIRG